jgi:ParB-like nuclease domain
MESAESSNERSSTIGVTDAERIVATKVKLDLLASADSPRRAGESVAHVRRLADSQERLPPILVHRPTMRVIDGMHRLKAAVLRGQEEIEVRYVDGDEASAFVLAVRANTTHGLPLTLADRKAAAARIMDLYPEWSDRMIAMVTGLAAKTVAAERRRTAGENGQLDSRIGRDGRVRPVNGAERRQIVARLLSSNPRASLREVARVAGVSPETVRSVRAQLERDLGPLVRRSDVPSATVPPAVGAAYQPAPRRADRMKARLDGQSVLRALWADPAFRSNESARNLLRLLSTYLSLEHGDQLIENVPVHCLSRVACAAGACAHAWQDFAERVEKKRIIVMETET